MVFGDGHSQLILAPRDLVLLDRVDDRLAAVVVDVEVQRTRRFEGPSDLVAARERGVEAQVLGAQADWNYARLIGPRRPQTAVPQALSGDASR